MYYLKTKTFPLSGGETWVSEQLQLEQEGNPDITTEKIVSMMEKEFRADNESVDIVLSNHCICGTNCNDNEEYDWYEYDSDGMATFLVSGTIRDLAKDRN